MKALYWQDPDAGRGTSGIRIQPRQVSKNAHSKRQGVISHRQIQRHDQSQLEWEWFLSELEPQINQQGGGIVGYVPNTEGNVRRGSS